MPVLSRIVVLLMPVLLAGCQAGNVIPGMDDAFTKPLIEKVDSQPDAESVVRRGVRADFYYSLDDQNGLVRDKALENYANRIYQQFNKIKPYGDIRGKVYFTPARNVNAQSHADGNIFVNYGAFRQLKSEAAFAGLIAHEYAHLLLGHHETDEYIEYQKRLFKIKNKLQNLKYTLEKSLDGQAAGDAAYDLKRDALYKLIFLSEGFFKPSWQRSQEIEADKLAFDLLQKAGYQTSGMGQFFRVMEASDKALETARRDRVEKQIAEKGFAEKVGVASGEFARAVSSLFTEDHPPADVREEELREYTLNVLKYSIEHKLPKVKVRAESREWKKLSARRTTDRIYQAIEQIDKASWALHNKEIEEAGQYSAKAESLLGGDGSALSYQPFSRKVRADYRLKQNSKAGALANIRLAQRSPYTPFAMHIEAYQLQSPSAGRYKQLLKQFKQYQSPPYAYKPMIDLARKAGLKKQATSLLRECEENFIEQVESCEPDTESLLEAFDVSKVMDDLGL